VKKKKRSENSIGQIGEPWGKKRGRLSIIRTKAREGEKKLETIPSKRPVPEGGKWEVLEKGGLGGNRDELGKK